MWQAGVRGTACIWSPLLPPTQRVSQQVMHIQDWIPTLHSALGETPSNPPFPLDGIDAWPALTNPDLPSRDEVLHNIDPIRGFAALTQGNYKMTIGT
jgi:arylsulfatase A-like enzyme